MKKFLVLTVALMIAMVPMAAANPVCDNVDSEDYLQKTGARLVRGVGNVAFSWTELFRQPAMAENKIEGFGTGILYTIGRALAGALEAVTSFIPNVDVPQIDPACPTDLISGS